MKITAEPRSDQWNADDFIGGPRIFTIAGVRPGNAEQKYDIDLVEGEGRCWRPPLTVLRLLMEAWGDEAAVWEGRRVELYRDPSVRFGADQVGGIRVSRMSHLDKPLNTSLTVSRGKRKTFKVQPLPDAPPPQQQPTTQPEPTREDVAACTDKATLSAMWRASGEEMRNVIEARVAELATGQTDAAAPDEGDPWAGGEQA